MNVNLEPKQKVERYLVEPDAYIATVVEISDIRQEKGFPKKNEQTGILEQKMVDKFRIDVELDQVQNGKKVRLPYFMTASVSHASKSAGYSDSNLYTLLNLAKELDNFKVVWNVLADQSKEEQHVAFVDWLRAKLLSRKLKVMTKTVQGLDGSKYSVVQQVVKFE